jgi:hypothetical protein
MGHGLIIEKGLSVRDVELSIFKNTMIGPYGSWVNNKKGLSALHDEFSISKNTMIGPYGSWVNNKKGPVRSVAKFSISINIMIGSWLNNKDGLSAFLKICSHDTWNAETHHGNANNHGAWEHFEILLCYQYLHDAGEVNVQRL